MFLGITAFNGDLEVGRVECNEYTLWCFLCCGASCVVVFVVLWCFLCCGAWRDVVFVVLCVCVCGARV